MYRTPIFYLENVLPVKSMHRGRRSAHHLSIQLQSKTAANVNGRAQCFTQLSIHRQIFLVPVTVMSRRDQLSELLYSSRLCTQDRNLNNCGSTISPKYSIILQKQYSLSKIIFFRWGEELALDFVLNTKHCFTLQLCRASTRETVSSLET